MERLAGKTGSEQDHQHAGDLEEHAQIDAMPAEVDQITEHRGNGEAEAVAPDPDVKLGDLEALQGVVKFPVRIKCATLSWNTLAQGLDESAAR